MATEKFIIIDDKKDLDEFVEILHDKIILTNQETTKKKVLSMHHKGKIGFSEVMRLIEAYDIKFELKLTYVDQTIDSNAYHARKKVFGETKGLEKTDAARNIDNQKNDIVNPELKDVVENAVTSIPAITHTETVPNSSLIPDPDFIS